MNDHNYAIILTNMKKFFDASTAIFEEKDSNFAPKPEMFTVAQHVAHVAHTVEWFIDGAFSPGGFSMDFEAFDKEVRAVKSLKEARTWMDSACKRALDLAGSTSMAEWQKPMAPGPIFGNAPRSVIFDAMTDHTAHHRGSLAVYARLLGKVPPMPYM